MPPNSALLRVEESAQARRLLRLPTAPVGAEAAANGAAGPAGVACGYSGRAWLRTRAASIAPSSPMPPFGGKVAASIFAAAKPAAGLFCEGAGNFAGDGLSCFPAPETKSGLALECEGVFTREGRATAAAARSAAVIGAATGATVFFAGLPFGCRGAAGTGSLANDCGARSDSIDAFAARVTDRLSGLPLGGASATNDRGGFLTIVFLTVLSRGAAGTGIAAAECRGSSFAAAAGVGAAIRCELLGNGSFASDDFGRSNAAVLAAAGPALAALCFLVFPKIST